MAGSASKHGLWEREKSRNMSSSEGLIDTSISQRGILVNYRAWGRTFIFPSYFTFLKKPKWSFI